MSAQIIIHPNRHFCMHSNIHILHIYKLYIKKGEKKRKRKKKRKKNWGEKGISRKSSFSRRFSHQRKSVTGN